MITRPPKTRDKKPFIVRVEDPLNTGHALVDAIHCVQIEGFIHDQNWLKHPLLQVEKPETAGKGKSKDKTANLSYQLVWAYLVDKYRPIKCRDSESNEAYYLKKFEGEWWATTYARLARELGIGKEAARNAIEFFVKRGLAGKRDALHLRDPEKPKERPFEIWPIPEKVREVTGRGNHPVELSEGLDTGNWVCNELAQIRFRGNVIDYNWLGHPRLLNKEGNTDGLLLLMVADLFFLHRPTEHYDPYTHQPLKRTKKFDGEKLYKGYRSWSESSGLTDLQLRRGVAELAKQESEVIFYEIGPVIDRAGEPTNNKVILELNLPVVLEITYGSSQTLLGQNVEAPPGNQNGSSNLPRQKKGGRALQSGGQAPKATSQAPEAGGEHSNKHSSAHSAFGIEKQHPSQCAIDDRDTGENGVVDDVDVDTSNSANQGKILSHPNADDSKLKRRNAKTTLQPGAPGEIEDLTARLVALDTGLTAKGIAPHVVADPGNARQVLTWWPHLNQAAMRDPGAVLLKCLREPGTLREPAGLRQQRAAEQDTQAEREAQKLAEAQAQARREKEARHQARLDALAAQWATLTPHQVEAIFDALGQGTPVERGTARDVLRAGGIERVPEKSVMWQTFFECVDLVLPDALKAAERMAQAAATPPISADLDAEDEDDDDFELPAMPGESRYERVATAIFQSIVDGVIGEEDIDDHAALEDFDDSERDFIKAEVLERLRKVA